MEMEKRSKRETEGLELVITVMGVGHMMELILLPITEQLKQGQAKSLCQMRIKVGILNGKTCNFLMTVLVIYTLQDMELGLQ